MPRCVLEFTSRKHTSRDISVTKPPKRDETRRDCGCYTRQSPRPRPQLSVPHPYFNPCATAATSLSTLPLPHINTKLSLCSTHTSLSTSTRHQLPKWLISDSATRRPKRVKPPFPTKRSRNPFPFKMPPIFSKSLSQAAATRLRSAHAIKAMLRDSLNIYDPKSEDGDSHPTDMPQSTATPATPFISDDELLSLDFPRDGFEDVDLDDDEPPYRTRKRHDSAASIATIIPATRPAPSPPKDKKKIRRTSSAWRVSSSKDGRRSLKRSHSSRNLLLELGEDDNSQVDSEQQVEDEEDDWSDEMPGLKLTTSTRADGVTTLNFSKASSTRALSLPAATASTAGADDLAHLSEFIAQEGYSARMLDSLYNTVVAGVRVRQRFDLSVNFKTRHIELWDVVNFKCVLSLLFTSESAETDDLFRLAAGQCTSSRASSTSKMPALTSSTNSSTSPSNPSPSTGSP